jgi:Na+-translocating ferredoxin:NAD+ oxidoreductase RnfD subunit
MIDVSDNSAREKPPQVFNRLLFLVKVINVLCFISLLEVYVRERSEYVVDISFIVGCIANAIVYKLQPQDRFFSTIIGLYYICLFVALICYKFWLR